MDSLFSEEILPVHFPYRSESDRHPRKRFPYKAGKHRHIRRYIFKPCDSYKTVSDLTLRDCRLTADLQKYRLLILTAHDRFRSPYSCRGLTYTQLPALRFTAQKKRRLLFRHNQRLNTVSSHTSYKAVFIKRKTLHAFFIIYLFQDLIFQSDSVDCPSSLSRKFSFGLIRKIYSSFVSKKR